MKSLHFRFLAAAAFATPLVALAHPGHDDPEFTWEFSHLAAHPVATIVCFAVIGLGAYAAWRLAKRSRSSRLDSKH